jgi:hypothetical protein
VTEVHHLHLPSHVELSEHLRESECRALLATRTFGRVGATSGGLPVIVPVRYEWSGSRVSFWTSARAELRALATGDVLAFEVDSDDPVTGAGWSVLVLGRATLSSTVAATAPDHGVELDCELISGRRFVLDSEPARRVGRGSARARAGAPSPVGG